MARIHTLGNGLRLVLDPMPLASAAVGLWVEAGARDETARENGAAHLLEHMAFKGTMRRSAQQIAEEIEAVGGHLNAATSYSNTGYYARVMTGDIPLALDVIADILTEPLLDADDLEKEKDVVLQEIGEAADTPDDVLFEHLQALAFQDQSLGRPILGSRSSVKALSADDLRAFIARHYAPARMVLSVSGGFDEDVILPLAERLFGGMPARDNTDGARPTPARFIGGAHHDSRPLEQAHVAFCTKGPGYNDEDYFAARMFVEILGGGMSSRLFQEVREKAGYAYSIYAFADAYEDMGCLGAYLGADEEDAVAALQLSVEQIARLAEAIEPRELERARAMTRSATAMGLENPLNRAERWAGQLFAYDRLIGVEEINNRLEAVSLEDVKQIATMVLGAKASLAVVGPADFDSMVDALPS